MPKIIKKKDRCSNTKTKQQVVAWVLSHMRRLTLKWKPRADKLNEGRIKMPWGKNGREIWANSCEECKLLFKIGDLHVDHIKPIGGMQSFEDTPRWLHNALVEVDELQRLCKPCHGIKTQAERKSKL